MVQGLLVAAPTPAQGLFDHLKCHALRGPLRPEASLDVPSLEPDFADQGCKLGRPKLFCVPAALENASPASPLPGITGEPLHNAYVGYKLKCPSRPPDDDVSDRFGPRRQTKYRSTLLLGPARRSAAPVPQPPCVATVQIDPAGAIPTLPINQAIPIPVRLSSVSGGTFDVFLDDHGGGGQITCPAGGCVGAAVM